MMKLQEKFQIANLISDQRLDFCMLWKLPFGAECLYNKSFSWRNSFIAKEPVSEEISEFNYENKSDRLLVLNWLEQLGVSARTMLLMKGFTSLQTSTKGNIHFSRNRNGCSASILYSKSSGITVTAVANFNWEMTSAARSIETFEELESAVNFFQ